MKGKGIGKFLLMSIGGLMLLMLIGVIAGSMLDYQPEEIKSINLIDEWQYYRIGFYALLMALWIPTCRYITRPKITKEEEQTDEERKKEAELRKKQARDFAYLKSSWWKVTLLLMFFELVIVQQFGI